MNGLFQNPETIFPGFQRGSIAEQGHRLAFSHITQKERNQLYLVAESSPKGSIQSQFEEIRTILAESLSHFKMRESVVAMSVFLPDIAQKQFFRQNFCEFFGDNLPAITYIPQTSCFGQSFSVELFAIGGDSQNFEIQRNSENSVLVSTSDMQILFCGDIRSDDAPVFSYDRSLNAFQRMKNLLSESGYGISDLYRTWIYQGHIVDPEGETQRYKELNRARSDVYHGQEFITQFLPQTHQGIAFPASTGIGADDYDVVISCQAAKSQRSDLIIVPLENPMQVPAFDYGEVYSPKSPKFSRATAYVAGTDAKVYISGTASITDSESRFEGDPERQTHQTLDNIAALVTPENLAKHGVNGFGATLENLAVVRVYVKEKEHFSAVRRVCEQRIAGTPVIYTFADVCRPELLVEIEGIVVPKNIP